jgi:hypothetical protein
MRRDQWDNEAPVSSKEKEQPPTKENLWRGVVLNLLNWGLGDAERAVSAARDRGLSIEDVDKLTKRAERLPERIAAGKLHKWLTGREQPTEEIRSRIGSGRSMEKIRAQMSDAIRFEATKQIRAERRGEPVFSDDPRVIALVAERLQKLDETANILGDGSAALPTK